jgi:anti-sigma factor (TIGR02949 family)
MTDEAPMTCEAALRLLAEFLDGELGDARHQEVEHHLAACRSCYSRAEFERRLKAEIGSLRREEVSPSFDARVRQLLDSFSTSSRGPAGGS